MFRKDENMKIYNTLTRQKEEFIPLKSKEVKMYVCGPTVYNYIHIGNARPLCVFDVFRRYLEYRGYDVIFVQNFTDIDDKIILKANEEGVTVKEIAEKYIREYLLDVHELNVRDATVHPKATENIGEIINFIKTLEEKGYAYESGGDVYFSTKAFNEYGKLSRQSLEDLEAGARVSLGELKQEPMDFALWKKAKPGEPSWTSPWSEGRPGWHIECSAMSRRYLGETFDIHAGGQDLIFPHHENEIAQSECANGVTFARYWMHNGYINVDNVKMSKSVGNFFTVRDVAEKYGYEPIRYLMVTTQYRMPINYSLDIIEQCKASLQRLYTCRDNLDFLLSNAKTEKNDGDTEIKDMLTRHKGSFIEAMDEDLNTADGVTAVFELVSDINRLIDGNSSKQVITLAASLFDELCSVLGLLYNRKKEEVSDEIMALVEKRSAARKEKNWTEADRIRDELAQMGITLEDTPQGIKIIRS
ncbi:MAG: Cysteine--tRNA ligase [Firmicutes bacterium ADurb.Bin300]|nr:MAG: Cysteine--tRNA ligase [Firmicutes bacterium ADurb.Bin300]